MGLQVLNRRAQGRILGPSLVSTVLATLPLAAGLHQAALLHLAQPRPFT